MVQEIEVDYWTVGGAMDEGLVRGDDGRVRCAWGASHADFGPDDVQRLLQDPGIIRHRGKIERLAKALKQRGFRFVGPTTAYAFMQAMGLVNDHVEGCFARGEIGGMR